MLKKLFAPPAPPMMPPTYPINYDYQRLETELRESQRQVSELNKRLNRIETYLGIRTDQDKY